MVAHDCDLSIQRARVGGLLQIPGQPGLKSETYLKTKQKETNKKAKQKGLLLGNKKGKLNTKTGGCMKKSQPIWTKTWRLKFE